MNKIILLIATLCISGNVFSITVKNIAAEYHDGQVFITWNNGKTVDTGFYYIYTNTVPITEANIQTSKLLGRVPFNFSYDYRLTYSVPDHIKRYLITNDNPLTVLNGKQNLFVMNCTNNGQSDYFAVQCNFGKTSPNWTVVPGSSATTVPVVQHLDPIKAYLQEVYMNSNENNESLEIYLHYGGNVAVGSYPEMANEACLPFHFGIVKSGPVGGNNQCFIKFHGGNGNFITNAIPTFFENTWKLTFDDWIPAYSYDSIGTNTRWLGYWEKLPIYTFTDDSPTPTSGIIKAYTYYRINWEIEWIRKTWPGTIDTTRIYLSGSSQGCGGALLHAVIEPERFAAITLQDGKFNLDAPEDDNPECKYNNGNSGRKNVRVIWGNEDDVNLNTNIPTVPGGSVYYKIYDLTNMNDMFTTDKAKSLPFIRAINGKYDDNTCWEEKPNFYNKVQSTNAGGVYFWDLRGHSGGNNAWPSLKLEDLTRFRSDLTYPAFSNCSLDGDAGTTSNPYPPYFSGDDTGAIHGNIDWVDSSLVDNANSWEAEIFIFKQELNNGGVFPSFLPAFATSDVTIRRTQKFKGFPSGTKLCWVNIHNGDTIQTGIVKQKYNLGIAQPVTMKGIKVYTDGSLLRMTLCNLKAGEANESAVGLAASNTVYPNPFTDQLMINFYCERNEEVSVVMMNLFGEKISEKRIMVSGEGIQTFTLDEQALSPGIYFVKVFSGVNEQTFKVVKE